MQHVKQFAIDDIPELPGQEALFDAGQDPATMQISTISIIISLVLKHDAG